MPQEKDDKSPATPGRHYIGPFFLGCLGTFLLLGFLLWTAYQESERQAETTARNIVDVLEAQVNGTLRRVHTDLEEIAATVPERAMRRDAMPGFAESINGELKLHARNFPEIVGYRIMDADGIMLYTSQPELPQANVVGRGYFDDLKADPQRGIVFSEVSIGRITPRPLMFAAVAVRGKAGEFLGIVLAPIDLDYFQRQFDAVDLGGNGVVTFRRSDDGRLVVRRPVRPETVNRSLQNNPMHQRIEAGDREGIIRFVAHIDGIERIYAYRRVGDYPFYLAAGIASYDYLSNWRSTAAVVLVASFCILLLLGMVIWRLGRLEAKERRLTAELRESEVIYRTLLEAAPFPIVIARLSDSRVHYINQRAAQWLGTSPEEILGISARDLYEAPESRERMMAILRQQGQIRDFEMEMRRQDGERRWVLMSVQMADFHGERCTFASFSDISERRAAELATAEANARLQAQLDEIRRLQDALREQAIRDGLTGLFNRRYLDETLERELSRARREGWSLSLILLDLDHFKKINDTYGHQAGDLVLKALARRLLRDIRTEDVPCRYGGEEFLVLLPGMPLEAAVERAEAWCREIRDIQVVFGEFAISVTASLGVATYPNHAKTPDQLAQCADRALYEAKRRGRNQVAIHGDLVESESHS